ncbi:hypothetical protein BGW80DRAFT_1559889 [Lactifluus volemus]|nr:hypothetical protein BGW80DRAFT_1559889 [Lactifluus volemus]
MRQAFSQGTFNLFSIWCFLPAFWGSDVSQTWVGWASTLLALLSCAFIPIPILLYFYGERIRLASKHAQHKY